MNLTRLRSFLTIAEAGGFRRAADILGLSQPTLSRQIGVLEAELGATLIRRGRPPLALTEAGQFVARNGERLLADATFLRQEAMRLDGGRDPTLCIGVLQSLLEGIFAAALLIWRQAWPHVPVRVTGFRSSQIIADVAEGRQQLGLVAVQPADTRLTWRLITRDRFVAVFPPDHAMARTGPRDPVDLEALVHEGLVLPPRGFDLRQAVDVAFAARGLTPRINAELEGIGVILAIVRAGLGPSVLPASAVARESGLVIRPLSGSAPERGVGAVWLAARNPDPAVDRLLAEVTRAAAVSQLLA